MNDRVIPPPPPPLHYSYQYHHRRRHHYVPGGCVHFKVIMQYIVSGFDEPSMDDGGQVAGTGAVDSPGAGAGAEVSSIPDRIIDQWGFPIQVRHAVTLLCYSVTWGGGCSDCSVCVSIRFEFGGN